MMIKQILNRRIPFILLIAIFTLTIGCTGEDGKDGIDGINGTDGQNGQNGQNASGKTYIYLSGNITDAEAVTILQNDLGSLTQFIYIQNTTQLTTVNLAGVTELVNLQVSNNNSLTTVLIPDLTTIQGNLLITQSPQIVSLNLPNLIEVFGAFSLSGNNSNSLQTINLSVLEYVGSLNINSIEATSLNFTELVEIGNIYVNSNTNLTQLLFPELIEITSNNSSIISYNHAISTITFPKLETVLGDFALEFNSSLVSIDMPMLTAVQGLYAQDCTSFTGGYNVPLLTSFDAFTTVNSALPASRVNAYLNQFVNITPTLSGKYIEFWGQIPSAPPTGQGITDKATLITNGNYVATD